MSFGIVASKYRRKGSGQPTLIDGLPVTQELGDRWYVNQARSSSGDGTSWDAAYKTIQEGVNKAANNNNDRVFIAPGAYNETVTIANTKNMLTLIGVGGLGAAFIEPATVGAEGMLVQASDVTLINLGVAGEATSDYALKVAGNRPGGTGTKFGRRFRAFHCKFERGEGTGPVIILTGDDNYQVADLLLSDCEVAWATQGIHFVASGYGVPTQVFIEGCRFHNLSVAHISDPGAADYVADLSVRDCEFMRMQNGDAPTNFINIGHANSTGLVSGCRFGVATNSNINVVGAGVLWSANATEAGWSTARPTGS